MKVAVIGKANHLHWDHHVAEALREIDCKVLHARINRRSIIANISRTASKIVGKKNDRVHAEKISAQVKAFEPDIILLVSVFFIPLEFLEELSQIKGHALLCGWDGDCATDLESSKSYAGLLDCLFIANHGCVARNQTFCKKVMLLNLGVNSRMFMDRKVKRENKMYFCARYNYERANTLVGAAIVLPIIIKGNGWKGICRKHPNTKLKSSSANLHTLIKDYNRYWFYFNMIQTENGSGGLNMRNFEVPACGGLLVNNHEPYIEEIVDIENEMICFKTPEEMNDKLMRCLRDPGHARRLAKNGQRRVLAKHTYAQRMKELLSLIA